MRLLTAVHLGWIKSHALYSPLLVVTEFATLTRDVTPVPLTAAAEALKYAIRRQVDVTPQQAYAKHHAAKVSLFSRIIVPQAFWPNIGSNDSPTSTIWDRYDQI